MLFEDDIFDGDHNPSLLSIDDFKLCEIAGGKKFLGQGAFGKVFLAQNKSEGKYYAIKDIRKSMLIDHDIIEMTQLESRIMFDNDHPNLIKMHWTFQSTSVLYFVMDYVQGGELRTLLNQHGQFQEDVVKFYAV